MPLEVPEGPVIAQGVEPVVGALEGPAGLVAPVRPLSDVRAEQRHPLVGREAPHPRPDLVLGQVRVRVAHRGEELVLAVGIEVGEDDRGSWLRRLAAEKLADELGRRLARVAEVLGPGAAALGAVDAGQERRDHLPELGEHHRRVPLRFGQRMRPHAHQERLEGLPRAVDADVRQRRPGQDAASGVTSFGLDGLLVDEVGVAGLLRVAGARPIHEVGKDTGVGVEEHVEVGDVARPQRRPGDLRVPPVSVPPAEAAVVRDVAGRLLEVRHEAAPLEDLREQVRRLLASQVHASELGHRVVAVLEEHPVVELLGSPEPDGRVDGEIAREVEVADELVEEQAPQALGRARIAGEQGALHDLGQVDEREDGRVEVREVRAQHRLLLVGEALGHVLHAAVRVRWTGG